MKIALVGAKRRIDQILESWSNGENIVDLIPYRYNHYKEVVDVVKKIDNVDGILFTGKLLYEIIRTTLNTSVVLDYLEFDESCLMKILFPYAEKLPDKISVDTISRNTIRNVYKELGARIRHIRTTYLSRSVSLEDIVRFHINNYENVDGIKLFTCFYTVHESLKEEGIPCDLVSHTYFSIRKGIDKIMNKIYFRDSNKVQPAVGVIQIDNFNKLSTRFVNEFKLQKILLKLHEEILDFQDQLSSFVINRSIDSYYFISTRSLIEEYTDNYRDFPLLYEIFSKFNFTVSIGIGYGTTPMSAYHNAKEALVLAQETGNSIKILTDAGDVITPKGTAWNVYRTRITDKSLKEISKKTGIGPVNITKIIGFLERNQKRNITAYELSKALHITKRSGGRLIAKLVSAGLAKEVGLEQPPRGRPRKIYKVELTA